MSKGCDKLIVHSLVLGENRQRPAQEVIRGLQLTVTLPNFPKKNVLSNSMNKAQMSGVGSISSQASSTRLKSDPEPEGLAIREEPKGKIKNNPK